MAPRPTAQQLKVATDDLRTEARTWTDGSDSLTSIANEVSALKFNRTEAGLFQLIVSTHSELVEAVSERCKEGSIAFDATGATLKVVADTYDDEDRRYAEQLKDIW